VGTGLDSNEAVDAVGRAVDEALAESRA
jgi:hypothetical protein